MTFTLIQSVWMLGKSQKTKNGMCIENSGNCDRKQIAVEYRTEGGITIQWVGLISKKHRMKRYRGQTTRSDSSLRQNIAS